MIPVRLAFLSALALPLTLAQGDGAHAQSGAGEIAGCSAVLTAQYRGCRVEHVYDCGERGMVFASFENGQQDSLDSYSEDGDFRRFIDVSSGTGIIFDEGGDPMSIAALRRDGMESADKTGAVGMFGPEPVPGRFTLQIQLDPEMTAFDDVRGQTGRAAMAVSIPDADVEITQQYDIFLPADLDVVFAEETHTDGVPVRAPRGMMSLVRDGAPGFLLEQGLHDCGEAG